MAAALVLTVLFESFAEPLLLMFGASENTVGYALDYMRIYALGTIFVQITLGLNAFITAQGFAKTSASCRNEGRKGGNYEYQRHADAQSRQRKAAGLGDMSDVNAVNDVVQHIHKLRYDRRYGKSRQKLFYGLRAEKCFVVLHEDPSLILM